jgi:hypothetical protein
VPREQARGAARCFVMGACQGTLIVIALRLSEISRGARGAHLGPWRNRGVRNYTSRALTIWIDDPDCESQRIRLWSRPAGARPETKKGRLVSLAALGAVE